MDMQEFHLHLSKPQMAKLQELSEKTGLPIAELIRRAVDEFLSKPLHAHGLDAASS